MKKRIPAAGYSWNGISGYLTRIPIYMDWFSRIT